MPEDGTESSWPSGRRTSHFWGYAQHERSVRDVVDEEDWCESERWAISEALGYARVTKKPSTLTSAQHAASRSFMGHFEVMLNDLLHVALDETTATETVQETEQAKLITDGGRVEDESGTRQLEDQCSMDHWWPRLQNVDVPTPETVRLPVRENEEFQGGLALPVPGEDELREAISEVGGPPAFLRSDVMSRKHQMGASRIEQAAPPANVVAGVVEAHHLAMGAPMPSAWYIREWLDLVHYFKGWAYDHHDFPTPVAAEVRFFLLDGEVYDHGFYWPKDAIRRPDRDDWEEAWQRTRDTALAPHRLDKAKEYARQVAEEFGEGYWSADFALAGPEPEWYCIDMARGELSWHPDGIEQAREVERLV